MIRINFNLIDNNLIVYSENFNKEFLNKLPLRLRTIIKSRVSDFKKTGFWVLNNEDDYFSNIFNIKDFINKIVEGFKTLNGVDKVEIIVDENIEKLFNKKKTELNSYKNYGIHYKKKKYDSRIEEIINDFSNYIDCIMKNRKLSNEQKFNACFSIIMQSSCNFSVPGAGKTTTVLAAYAYLKKIKKVDKLIVIGPKSCFKSWIDEFYSCFNYLNYSTTQNFSSQYSKYQIKDIFDEKEMILINYDVVNKMESNIIENITNKYMLIFDECHKIKKFDGTWAKSCINISLIPIYKILLTGTPIPNGYQDIINLLKIMHGSEYYSFWNNFTYDNLKKNNGKNVNEFKTRIFPFYVRTTKKDLNIPPPNKDNIISYSLTEIEKEIYERIYFLVKKSNFILIIRLLQSLSIPNKLIEKIDISDCENDEIFSFYTNKNELGLINDKKITNLISNNKNTPSKILKLVEVCKILIEKNKTILVWTIFVDTMYVLKKHLMSLAKVEIINGSVPLEKRNQIIEDFKSKKIKILIANPQTIAESVSLHKNCHDAIYFDYSYNLTHMLQSRDRIHRFGLDKNIETNYYYFLANNLNINIEKIIYNKLLKKEELMNDVLNAEDLIINEDISEKDFIEEILRELK